MKRHLLTALFLVYYTTSFTQENDNIKQNNLTKKVINNPISTDTIYEVLKKNFFTVSADSNEKLQIILTKEETSNIDWAKYILPILTLFLGIGINRFIDWINKRSATIKNGERWVVEIRTTEIPIIQQMTDLIEFRDSLSLTELVIPEIKAMTNLNGDAFKSLDKSELIKFIELKNSDPLYKRIFYSKEKKEKAYKEVINISNFTHGHIAILEHQFTLIGEKFNSYAKGTSEHVQSLNKHLQEFLSEYGMYNLNYEKDGVNIFTDERTEPLIFLYASQIAPYTETGTYNPFKLRKDFFVPAITHLSHNRFEEKTLPLTKSITACLNDIAGIEIEVVHMTKNLNIILERYTELLNSLPSLINNILGKKNSEK